MPPAGRRLAARDTRPLRAPPSAGRGTGNAGHLRRAGSRVVIRWPCAKDSEDRPPAPRPRSSGRLGGRQRSVPADGQPSDRRPNRRSAAGRCRGPTASYGTLCVRRCPSLDAPEPPLGAAPGSSADRPATVQIRVVLSRQRRRALRNGLGVALLKGSMRPYVYGVRMPAESPVIGQPERGSGTFRAVVPAANGHCERADRFQPPASHGDQQR
jgi:hypothetical protein